MQLANLDLVVKVDLGRVRGQQPDRVEKAALSPQLVLLECVDWRPDEPFQHPGTWGEHSPHWRNGLPEADKVRFDACRCIMCRKARRYLECFPVNP